MINDFRCVSLREGITYHTAYLAKNGSHGIGDGGKEFLDGFLHYVSPFALYGCLKVVSLTPCILDASSLLL